MSTVKRELVEIIEENEDAKVQTEENANKKPKTENIAEEKTKKENMSVGYICTDGRRNTMEDNYTLIEDINEPFNLNLSAKRSFFGIYDGHGGKESSQLTSEYLHKNIIDTAEFAAGNIEGALSIGFEKTNKFLVDNVKKEYDGTTSVVCMIINNSLYIANVGDSEAIIAETTPDSTKHILLTEIHKPEKKEKERIINAGGIVMDGRVDGMLNMSRAMGGRKFKFPHNKGTDDFTSAVPFIKNLTLSPQHTFIVLASDGLWNKMSYTEVVSFVVKSKAEGMSPTEVCTLLAKKATGFPFDNITIIIIYLS